jgi:hypothetical protein
MAVQQTTFDIVTATFTMSTLAAVTLIEENYYKSLSSFPENLALQRRVPPAGGVQGAPPTTLGIGYQFYVPQAVSFASPALDREFSTLAASATNAVGLTVSANGLAPVANIVVANASCPFIDVFLEEVAQETNPYFRFGLNDVVIDARLVTTGVAAVLDVIEAIPLNLQITPNIQGIGRYKGYRFYKPFKKFATTNSDILQIRCSYPTIPSAVVNQTPTGTFRLNVSGMISSNA